MGETDRVNVRTYVGLFLVTMATMMFEILLTRIFSVTMWYHFAFMAISIAMFGMTVGAIVVFLLPGLFDARRAGLHLAIGAVLFAMAIPVSFIVQLRTPFVPTVSPQGLMSAGLTYLIVAVPFLFSGICTCVALTKFPYHVGRMYAADLAGAATGCLALVSLLNAVIGPVAVLHVAVLAVLGAIFFAMNLRSALAKLGIFGAGLCLLCLALASPAFNSDELPLLRLRTITGKLEVRPLYERWNSYSRIRVDGDPAQPLLPHSLFLSPVYPGHELVHQLALNIDVAAATILTYFDGDTGKLDYLRWDITNLAHQLRPDAHVLVIGVGGGRDILSALAFNQKSVVGVEMNRDILRTVNGVFGDFTGHLDHEPKVIFVNDEARSFVARSKDRFDIIQISFIDTWAATGAGAFVLTENSLYTVEAWKSFLEHLTPRGILSVNRWYFRDRPGEMYRATALATKALLDIGIKNPRNHILIARHMVSGGGWNAPDGAGAVLVSRRPFSAEDVSRFEKLVSEQRFDVVLDPGFALEPAFAGIASGKNLDGYVRKFDLNIAPPTDDSPFFFQMLRLRDMFNSRLWQQGIVTFNMQAVSVLGTLLLVVTTLTAVCIIAPLIVTTNKGALRGAFPLTLYFSSIGLGFMLIEISQMQRLIVFLGHPTYSLTVVLFTLLIAGGLGSFLTDWLYDLKVRQPAIPCLFMLLIALVIFGQLTPYEIHACASASTEMRIAVAAGILFPLGLFMGMAFPFGMRLAQARSPSLCPWLWGVNGAMSVLASVLAIAIAISASIATTFWTGCACYLCAFISFAYAAGKRQEIR